MPKASRLNQSMKLARLRGNRSNTLAAAHTRGNNKTSPAASLASWKKDSEISNTKNPVSGSASSKRSWSFFRSLHHSQTANGNAGRPTHGRLRMKYTGLIAPRVLASRNGAPRIVSVHTSGDIVPCNASPIGNNSMKGNETNMATPTPRWKVRFFHSPRIHMSANAISGIVSEATMPTDIATIPMPTPVVMPPLALSERMRVIP